MKGKIIEFTEDPMIKMSNYEPLDDKIFYLNDLALDELNLYSYPLETPDIPRVFKENLPTIDGEKRYCILALSGVSEDKIYGIYGPDAEFPNTIFAIENTANEEYPSKIIGKYVSDQEFYIAPKRGKNIFLKMTKEKRDNKIKMIKA